MVLRVELANDLYDRMYSPIVAARLALSQPLQVYSATLTVAARFDGLRYWMYYWRTPVASLFISIAAMWQIVLMGVAWSVLEAYTSRSTTSTQHTPAAPTPHQVTTDADAPATFAMDDHSGGDKTD
ncbi:hypothetical protein GGI03_007801 [Coemansia sp. RSA 2337]|nr:hypothetical protein GGI03_007801 [Coemansia sp. RSA 2337]